MAQSHPEAAALYRAILAEPDEDTPRLVYADWLQEHATDPSETARADFIRLQCQLARMQPWDDGFTAAYVRTERLQREHWRAWPKNALSDWGWERGFPNRANWTADITAEIASAQFGDIPGARVEISVQNTERTDPALWRITSDIITHPRDLRLEIKYERSAAARRAACEVLAGAANRSGLTRLEISGDPTIEGLEAVVTSRHLKKLESFSLGGDNIGDPHAQTLAEKMALPALRGLRFWSRGLTAAGARCLAGAGWFADLHTLRLAGSKQLGGEGLRALFDRTLPNLRALHIRQCEFGGAEAAVAGGEHVSALEEVVLGGCRLDGQSWRELTGGPQRFRSLELEYLRLDANESFECPALRDLRRLIWQGYERGALGALAHSGVTQTLRWADLPGADGANAGATLLAGRDWPHLERLVLRCAIPGESLAALIESEKFPRLVSLCASCRDGYAKLLKRLARSPATAKFRELDLHVPMTSLAASELIDSPHLGDIDCLVVRKGRATVRDCERLVERFGARLRIT